MSWDDSTTVDSGISTAQLSRPHEACMSVTVDGTRKLGPLLL